MNKNIEKTDELLNEPRENVIAGAVGAFLFALVGGVLWYVLYQVGILAAISGLIGVVCAIKGYSIFAKKESIKGIVISVILAVLVMVIAWYLCLATDVFNVHKEWLANRELLPEEMPTFFDCIRFSYIYFEDPEIAIAYFKDLGIGLLLCAVGCVSTISSAAKKVKNKKAAKDTDIEKEPVSDESEE